MALMVIKSIPEFDDGMDVWDHACGSCPVHDLIPTISFNRNCKAEGKQAVFCREGAQTSIALNNGLDTVATITVPLLCGNRQTISHDHITGIGILNLDQNSILSYFTIKLHPFFSQLRLRCRLQCVFQSVGYHRAKFGIGQRQLFGKERLYRQPDTQTLRLAVIRRTK